MIVSRFDYAMGSDGGRWGVGQQLLQNGSYDQGEVDQLLSLLARRRAHFGDGVMAVDCGANFGVHTISWGKAMTGWGHVIAIEAQERVFYALAGNIALNNCLNTRAINAAIAAQAGTIQIPVPNYLKPANLGGLELRSSDHTESIGQTIDYAEAAMVEIRSITIDGLNLQRLDLLKIDVEGMEAEALDGALVTIEACQPIIVVEYVKTGWDILAERLLPLGYTLFRTHMNMIAVHSGDPTHSELHQV